MFGLLPWRLGIPLLIFTYSVIVGGLYHGLQSSPAAFFGALAALAVVMALIIHFGFSRRVVRILDGVRSFVAGDLNARIELRGRDELARIALALERGAREIARSQHDLRHSEARLSEAQRIARIGHWELVVGEDVLQGSKEQMRLLGLPSSRSPLPLSEFLAMVHAEDRDAIAGRLHAAANGSFSPFSAGYRIVRTDGELRFVQSRWGAERASAGAHLIGTMQDITDQRSMRLALEEAGERAIATLHSIGDGVITTDARGRVEYLNPAAETLTGWRNEDAAGRPLDEVFGAVDEHSGESTQDLTQAPLGPGKPASTSGQMVLLNRSGERKVIEQTASPILAREGKLLGLVLVFHDITETRQLTQELEWQARHDALTGLANRNEFERRLRDALEAARSEGNRHALIYLDLDQFKVVNDTCGHSAGDELLRQLPVVLREVVRDGDTFARLGGDEFALILHCCELEDACTVAEKLLSAICEFRFVWEDRTFEIGASIGVVGVNPESRDVSHLLTAADLACYSAKDNGRGRIHVYQPEDEELAKRHGELYQVATINQALEENRFTLYMQPIVPCALNSAMEISEILLRMVDESGRIIPPGAFIPAAERYDLMPAVDRWVIRHLFENYGERLQEAARSGNQLYSINLSGTSLSDERFRRFVLDEIERCKVPPQTLCFEITETAAIANLSRTRDFILELRRLGCRFALDDFGAGVSSFAYLKNLPVDYLKIDGSFIRDLLDDPIDGALVQAINYVGHQLGIQTIAEFLENETLFDLLEAMGVDYAQGYAIGMPAPLGKI